MDVLFMLYARPSSICHFYLANWYPCSWEVTCWLSFCLADSFDHEPPCKVLERDNSSRSPFEIEANHVEWPLKSPNVVNLASLTVSFIQIQIVELGTSLLE